MGAKANALYGKLSAVSCLSYGGHTGEYMIDRELARVRKLRQRGIVQWGTSAYGMAWQAFFLNSLRLCLVLTTKKLVLDEQAFAYFWFHGFSVGNAFRSIVVLCQLTILPLARLRCTNNFARILLSYQCRKCVFWLWRERVGHFWTSWALRQPSLFLLRLSAMCWMSFSIGFYRFFVRIVA